MPHPPADQRPSRHRSGRRLTGAPAVAHRFGIMVRRYLRQIRTHPLPMAGRAAAGGLLLTVLIILAAWLSTRGAGHLTTPAPTPFFEDRYGDYLSEGWGGDDGVKGFWAVPDPIPERIRACILAIEDKRFSEHPGVDLRALGRAAWQMLTLGPRQGASTIAMQVARLQNPGSRTPWHKLQEMIVALDLVRRYGRHEVLRQYLRLAPMGNQIFGVAYAARRYFRKPLADLGWAEAALLASLPKAPGRMNLFRVDGFRAASLRAALILRLLHQQGQLSDSEYQAAGRQLNTLVLPVREYRPFNSYQAIFRMSDMVRSRSTEDFTQPLRTTLDLDLQDYLADVARSAMAAYRPVGAGNIAIMVVELPSGAIRGYLGSDDYHNRRDAGAINYATTPRSSGSSLKPFIYALGLADHKFTPASVLADLPLYITHASGDYSVSNFDDSFLGPMLYRQALANSRNIPAVNVLKINGLDQTYDLFRQLGLADTHHDAGYYGLGLAIGGLYVTLEDLVRAYGVLATDGREFHLHWFDDAPPGQRPPAQVLPEDVARRITLFLSDPLARLPSFARLGILDFPFPVAVKTGTSQGFRDAWTVAYSSRYLVGAWIGHPNNDRMKDVSGLAAAAVVRRILTHLQPKASRGVNEVPFPPPRGFRAVRLCPLSGCLATRRCDSAVLEYFRPGTEPVAECPVHRDFAVDRRTGNLAGPATPAAQVEIKTCVVLPPEYAAWGARRGYGPPPTSRTRHPLARIRIQEPVDGSHFFLDPATPRRFQTLALKALVEPSVPEIVWLVDGRPLKKTPYPYVTRWPLTPGVHTIQARFPRAGITSTPVTVRISR